MGKGQIRRVIHPDLLRECEQLKKQIIRDNPKINPNNLTFPKLQKLLLEQRAINFRRISQEKIMRILLG